MFNGGVMRMAQPSKSNQNKIRPRSKQVKMTFVAKSASLTIIANIKPTPRISPDFDSIKEQIL